MGNKTAAGGRHVAESGSLARQARERADAAVLAGDDVGRPAKHSTDDRCDVDFRQRACGSGFDDDLWAQSMGVHELLARSIPPTSP